MSKGEIFRKRENEVLTKCVVSRSLGSTASTVKLTFENQDGELNSFLLTGPSDLDSIGELFSCHRVWLVQDTDSQKDFGTITLGMSGESYTEIFFDSVDRVLPAAQADGGNA